MFARRCISRRLYLNSITRQVARIALFNQPQSLRIVLGQRRSESSSSVEPFGYPYPRSTSASQARGPDSPSGSRAKTRFDPLLHPCSNPHDIPRGISNPITPTNTPSLETSFWVRQHRAAQRGVCL
jgi:hypothetical protein